MLRGEKWTEMGNFLTCFQLHCLYVNKLYLVYMWFKTVVLLRKQL